MGNDENVELNELEECIRDLGMVIYKLEGLKDDERFRGRSLSIALTEIETGEMWLNGALSDYDERKYKESIAG